MDAGKQEKRVALSCGLKAALASRFVAGKVLTFRTELTVTSALTSVQRPEAETSFLKDCLLVVPHESGGRVSLDSKLLFALNSSFSMRNGPEKGQWVGTRFWLPLTETTVTVT